MRCQLAARVAEFTEATVPLQFCVGTIEEDYLGIIGMPS